MKREKREKREECEECGDPIPLKKEKYIKARLVCWECYEKLKVKNGKKPIAEFWSRWIKS